MQNQAALAYQQVAKKTISPREIEANLLSRSAGRLQRIRDNWQDERSDLKEALTFNHKLWVVFMTSAAKDDNPLPIPVRQNIANLGIFVMNHTLEIHAEPQPAKLDVLITINRELAAGLRAANPEG